MANESESNARKTDGGDPNSATSAKADSAGGQTVPQKSTFYVIVKQATKYTILVAFILYCIGFLIWHSYLACYGVSSVGLDHVQYLSAALCYLLILVVMLAPPTLMIQVRIQRLSKRIEEREANGVDATGALGLGCTLAIILLWRFFPAGLTKLRHSLLAMFGITVLAFSVVFACACIPAIREWKIRNRCLFKILTGNTIFVILYLLAFSAYVVWQCRGRWLFLLASLIVLVLLALYFYESSREKHSEDERLHRGWVLPKPIKVKGVLMGSLCAYLVVVNTVAFGLSVFGIIPRSIGGGKAEKASIRFNQHGADYAVLLNLGKATVSAGSTNDFLGPILILVRSEKEVIFVHYALLYPANASVKPPNVTYQIRADLVDSIRFEPE